jgi:predicted MPP superfamily phosphohydrolase
LSLAVWLALSRRIDAHPAPFHPGRRKFLQAALPVVSAAPIFAVGTGLVLARSRPKLNEVQLRIKGLHPDLNGIRISQLSDIHYGPFFTKSDLEYAVAMANETGADIALVTGDLITRVGDDLEGCIGVLKKLRGHSGVWGCNGNHERYARAESYAADLAARIGIHILRNDNEVLRFGNAKLNLAGVDYQELGDSELLGAEDMLADGALNVLLSHSPWVFDKAVEQGFDVAFSGHTHGGQINLPLGHENLNMVRIYTPYIKGPYQRDGKHLFVSAGLGTVGVPVRLGADPEVNLIKLCAG